MPVYYYAIAIVAGVVVGSGRNSWKVGLLVGYMIILFSSMVLNRSSYASVRFALEPLWTYREWPKLLPETIVNIVSFIPIGLIVGNRWKGILIGVSFSLFIELSQLISHRGFFEIDDLINNTLGTIAGVFLIQLALFIYETRKRKWKV